MIEYVRILIAAYIMLIGVWLSADIIFEEKSKKNLCGILMLTLGSVIVSLFNIDQLVNLIGYTKVLVVFLMMIFFFKNRYNVKTSDALIGSSIIYVNTAISELAFLLIVSILEKILRIDILGIIRYGVTSDIIIVIISLLILKVLSKKYMRLFTKIKDNDTKLVTVIMAILVII